MRIFVGVVGATAMLGCETRDCALVADYIAGETLVDCGAIPSVFDGPSPAAYRAAQRCALAAAEQQQNFIVRWNVQGIDSANDRSIVGIRTGHSGDLVADFEIVSFDGQSYRGRYSTSRSDCAALEAEEPCETPIFDLCLRCVDPRLAATCEP